jgi:hypothetical protein
LSHGFDPIWRALRAPRPSKPQELQHREVVRLGVALYLTVQMPGVIQSVQPPQTFPRFWSSPTIYYAPYSPWGRAGDQFREIDLDETGMRGMINSLVASSTSTST